MKLICLDLDDCAYSHYITDDEFKNVNFKHPFKTCPECNYLAVLVPKDFKLNENKNFYLDILKKINEY